MNMTALRLSAVLAVAVVLPLAADEPYAYYPSGYNPIGTAPSTACSAGRTLATGAHRVADATPKALEARYRSRDASEGRALYSTKFKTFMIQFR